MYNLEQFSVSLKNSPEAEKVIQTLFLAFVSREKDYLDSCAKPVLPASSKTS